MMTEGTETTEGDGIAPVDIPTLTARLRAYIRQETLWDDGARLLVAVSGGPDSVALLDLLATQLAPAMGLWLAVGHVHHGLRAEAGEDADFVQRLAERYDLPCLVSYEDVPARMAAAGESLETAAREVRYAALQRMAHALSLGNIVTGHTADDQAETVLMRLLRGSGTTGLAAIPPRRDNIVRPLLPIWRSEILAYLRARALPYQTDASNASTAMLRNRLRLELLPLLERDYTPRIRERLARLAELSRDDDAVLSKLADDAYRRLSRPRREGIALPVSTDLPPALFRRVLRRALLDLRGSLEGIDFDHLQAIAGLATGQEAHLPGARVVREAGSFVFLPVLMEKAEIPATTLPVPGRLILPGSVLVAEESWGSPELQGGDVAIIDVAAVDGPLTVRSWQPGDRFRPFGAPGSRKLQDIFVDARVPRRLRAGVPLILDRHGIIWIAGFRIADRVKRVPTTTKQFILRIEWELNPWTLTPSDAG
ncbi:MAG TPA: tRNA lysidine(34) synthetase TilS [Armatimonadota bacterium]|jgi:tRNA(Ile)-lysidine synthase